MDLNPYESPETPPGPRSATQEPQQGSAIPLAIMIIGVGIAFAYGTFESITFGKSLWHTAQQVALALLTFFCSGLMIWREIRGRRHQ